MIRHPSENFIKYLMTSGHMNATDDNWVRAMIINFGYPPPAQDYLTWLRADINSKIPTDFDPSNRYHTASRRFMKAEGIFGIHTREKAVGEANLLVTNLRLRPVVEQLLLGRLDPKEVAKKVNSKYGTFHTTEGIDAYRHYYWQVGIIRVEDWNLLLQDWDEQRQKTNAIVQVGAAMALHKTGFQQSIDSKSMLRTMQEAMFFDFQEWRVKKHGSEKTKALTALAKSMVMVDEQLSQADSALKDSLKAFEQFRMETEKRAVPSVDSLAPGGAFTGSGVKLIDVKTSDEETS